MRVTVHHKSGKIDYIFLLLYVVVVFCIAAQLCLDARHKFERIEWFRYVIICTQGQARDLVGVLCFCSQHDYRKTITFTDLLQDGKTVHIRKHHIQKCQHR